MSQIKRYTHTHSNTHGTRKRALVALPYSVICLGILDCFPPLVQSQRPYSNQPAVVSFLYLHRPFDRSQAQLGIVRLRFFFSFFIFPIFSPPFISCTLLFEHIQPVQYILVLSCIFLSFLFFSFLSLFHFVRCYFYDVTPRRFDGQ